MAAELTGGAGLQWPDVPMQPFRTTYCPANALWMARLSKAVYAGSSGAPPDEDAILQHLKQHDGGFTSVCGFDARSSQACVVVHREFVVAVFRGTDEAADWLDNLNVVRVPGPFGEVHAGFHGALMDVWPDMRRAIRNVRNADSVRRPLWLTGHSLGGALATLAASRLVDDDEPFFGVYTYGAPRCGDKEFARVYRIEAGSRTYRFQNNNDVVSRVPARVMGYRHVGKLVYITEEGQLVTDIGRWYRFLDQVAGVVDDVGSRGLDSIKDHRAKKYVKAIVRWGDRVPDEH